MREEARSGWATTTRVREGGRPAEVAERRLGWFIGLDPWLRSAYGTGEADDPWATVAIRRVCR
ncbi:hypothetical protein GCM10010358_70240 [Streptomyces minutiscleroticus]|uniref:Uncharacterized protein n=1 Tax=Streptomyces minutiscleroticus TaxID=68238 RepID=A0A918U8D1_9ACTN|nr:hypothetical protein GCM10010358_70240 [Streptomyces minutiscleroticus]